MVQRCAKSEPKGGSMLKLCGFAASNYYNKVKLALLEKDIPFEEELVWASQQDDMLARSPLGKVPFIETAQGNLSESQAINDYLEDAHPQKPMAPAGPYERGRLHEFCTLMDWYIEWPARRLYAEAMFGGKVSDETREQVKKDLAKGVRAFRQRARFGPYVMGDKMTYADFTAFVHLPLIGMATKIIYGTDVFEDLPQVRPYIKMLKERPHFQRVEADRKQNVEALVERNRK
jgi:glutathione S-transferase